MKLYPKISMLLCLLCSAWYLSAQYTQQSKSLELTEYLNTVEEQYQVRFNYDYDLIKNEIRPKSNIQGSLDQLLKDIESEGVVSFHIIKDGFYKVKLSPKPKEVPEYKIICATVHSNKDDSLLEFATVNSSGQLHHSTTDESGYFKIEGSFYSSEEICVQYLGYESVCKPLSFFDYGHCPKIILRPGSNELEEILITDQLKKAPVSIGDHTKTTVDPAKLGNLSINDEDALTMVQLMPGISSTDENSSKLQVRGGTPDQNLILWDQITIYQSGHFFGLLSAINPNYIDQIDIYKSGFDARFGSRVSSVLDMKSQDDITDKVRGNLSSNLLYTNAFLDLPIIRDRLSISGSFRRSHTDLFNSITFANSFDQVFQSGTVVDEQREIEENDLQEFVTLTPTLSFYDFNSQLKYKVNDQHAIKLSILSSHDYMSFDKEKAWDNSTARDSIDLTNDGYSIQWKSQWNDAYHTELSLSNSSFKNHFSYEDDIDADTLNYGDLYYNEIDQTNLKWHHQMIKDEHKLGYGYELERIHTGSYADRTVDQLIDIDDNTFVQSTTNAIYFDYESIGDQKTVFKIGARASYYNLTDQYFIEPRLSLLHKINNSYALKANAGLYFQTFNQIERNNYLEVENFFWKLSDGSEDDRLIPIVKNSQFSGGIEYRGNDWVWSIEAFTKQLDNISSLTQDFSDTNNPYQLGNADIAGLEIWTHRRWNAQWSSILSYTLSEATLDFQFEEPYAAPYDARHQLSISNSYTLGRLHISLLFNLRSGKPYSPEPILAFEEVNGPDEGYYYLQLDNPYTLRTSMYHRLDLSASYTMTKAQHSGINTKLGIQLLNIMNRTNVISRGYYVDYFDWPEVSVGETVRNGIKFTPNVFLKMNF